MHLLAPSILQNFKKILRTDPELFLIVQNNKKFLLHIQSYEAVPFLGPKWSICHKQIFFLKTINIIPIYLLALLLCKILPVDPDLWGPFWPKPGVQKKNDVSKNIPHCHFLLTVILIAIRLTCKEFFKITKWARCF